jgi:L-threonylcarbamoyladenylate synthase
VPDVTTTAGQDTVALRVPAHPVALALLRACQRPLAAPSANRSGRPSPTLAGHVSADLDGRVALILDGGPTRSGSSRACWISVTPGRCCCAAAGVSHEQLLALLGPVDCVEGADSAVQARSPGLRHRHYAPRARVELVAEGEGEAAAARALASGERVGLICRRPVVSAASVRRLPDALEGFAQALFATLRALDDEAVDRIVVEAVSEAGIGAAIMDRLRRAASG